MENNSESFQNSGLSLEAATGSEKQVYSNVWGNVEFFAKNPASFLSFIGQILRSLNSVALRTRSWPV